MFKAQNLPSSKSLGSDLIYKIDMEGVKEQLYISATLLRKYQGS